MYSRFGHNLKSVALCADWVTAQGIDVPEDPKPLKLRSRYK